MNSKYGKFRWRFLLRFVEPTPLRQRFVLVIVIEHLVHQVVAEGIVVAAGAFALDQVFLFRSFQPADQGVFRRFLVNRRAIASGF